MNGFLALKVWRAAWKYNSENINYFSNLININVLITAFASGEENSKLHRAFIDFSLLAVKVGHQVLT